MADYSAFLYDSLAGIGEGMWKRKQDRLAEDQWNKSYAQRLLETEADQKWRESEAARAQANADRSYALDLMAAEAPASAPPPRPRAMTRPTINDLSAAGTGVTDLGRLSETWNDAYGGFGVGWWGDFNNWVARNAPAADEGDRSRATWWQDYQGYKNKVRHDLFGSALTATERAEFEKAVINPGMSPEAIRANLDLQRSAAERAATKLAKAYLAQGYPPDQIEAALGVPLAELGIAPPAGAGLTDMSPDEIASHVADTLAAGVPAEAIAARLRENGINPGPIFDAINGGQ